MNRIRAAYILILAFSLLWCSSFLLYPCLVRSGKTHPAFALHFFFSHICHQKPERSLSWQGIPLPICTRCLGAYAGWTLAILLFPLLRRGLQKGQRPLLGFLLSSALMLLDVLLQWLGFWEGSLSRLLTGGSFGFFLGLTVMGQIWRSPS